MCFTKYFQGGLLGGTCYAFATIKTLGACAPARAPKIHSTGSTPGKCFNSFYLIIKCDVGQQERMIGGKKMVVRKTKLARHLESKLQWSNGKKEWAVRITSVVILVGINRFPTV